MEASLSPEDCGSCHGSQLEGWRNSLHARAMGPGVLGQLADMDAEALDEHQACLRCHAPLAEQAQALSAALASGAQAGAATPGEPRPLFQHGVACAACHVRGYRWYGPPRRDGSAPTDGPDRFPHGAWTASSAFQDSRFCAPCHQFTPDQLALNGKLLENTYEEWKASSYAREGRTCQSCHMPERQHLWRGIHDPETTRRGVTIEHGGPRVDAGFVTASLTLRNTGTGHRFPTYVTPKVIVEGFQEDAGGGTLPGTRMSYEIARQVKLDLSEEIADTRLAPGEHATLAYRRSMHRRAAVLVLRVRVEPDAFYTAFYRSLLTQGTAGRGEALIRAALADSTASHYILHEWRQPLPPRQPGRRR